MRALEHATHAPARGEVDDRAASGHRPLDERVVEDRSHHRLEDGIRRRARQIAGIARGEVVEDQDGPPDREQGLDEVGADEARPARARRRPPRPREDRRPGRHPAQGGPAHAAGLRGRPAASPRRPRHAGRLRRPSAPAGRADLAHAPRAGGRHRLPRRGCPASGSRSPGGSPRSRTPTTRSRARRATGRRRAPARRRPPWRRRAGAISTRSSWTPCGRRSRPPTEVRSSPGGRPGRAEASRLPRWGWRAAPRPS